MPLHFVFLEICWN